MTEDFEDDVAPVRVQPIPLTIVRPRVAGKECIVLLCSGMYNNDEAFALNRPSVQQYYNCSDDGSIAKGTSTSSVLHAIGLATWSILFDPSECIANSHVFADIARTTSGTRGFLVYDIQQCFGIQETCELQATNGFTVEMTASDFQYAILQQFGRSRCTSGETLQEIVKRFQGRNPQLRLMRHETHHLVCRAAIQKPTILDVRPLIGQKPNDTTSRYSKWSYGHPNTLLSSSRHLCFFRPTKIQMRKLAAYFSTCSDWAASSSSASREVVVEVRVSQSDAGRRVAKGATRCRWRYDLWKKLNTIIASSHLRNVASVAQSTDDALIARYGDDGESLVAASLQTGQRTVSSSVQLAGVVRLDIACSIFSRVQWQRRRSEYREIMLDSSRINGAEAIAFRESVMYFETDDPDCQPRITEKRLAPINLGHHWLSADGKATKALHSVWRDYGPSQDSVESWFQNVVGCITDFGVEALIANAKLFLPLIYGHATSIRVNESLMPRCLRIIGANHTIDAIVRHIVSRFLEFYPAWVEVLKALVRVLGDVNYRAVLTSQLRAHDHEDAAKTLESRSVTFAKWRWGTLIRATKSILNRFAAFRDGWRDADFALTTSTDLQTASMLATNAERADEFMCHARFVVVLFTALEELRTWFTGSTGDDVERRNGRLKELYPH